MKHKALFKNKEFSPYSNVRKSRIFVSAKQICSILHKNGYEAYVVGGAVRDLVIRPNLVPKDLDIATSALPSEIKQLFENIRFVGESFGVCLVQHNDISFEVTTFRKDGEYIDRRRPINVTKGSFQEDANRRDFTINCLYFDPIKNKILDPHNGLHDIRQKIIQCVGDADSRLHEDALRIIRMCRFSANLHFQISDDCVLAGKRKSDGIYLLSKERILLEFKKIKLGRFFFFFENINKILDISLVFFPNYIKDSSDSNKSIIKNTINTSKIKIDTPYPFFNFLKTFLYINDINIKNYELMLQQFDQWPLTSEDKKICSLFLKAIHLKEHIPPQTEIEVTDFIFFEILVNLHNISQCLAYGIFINLSVFIKDPLLKETLYKMIEFSSQNKPPSINSSEVVKQVKTYAYEKKYISAIIKYLQYLYLKKGIMPKIQSILQFKNQFFKEYFEISTLLNKK